MTAVEPIITCLYPNRLAKAPANGIAVKDPAPRQSRISPSRPSSTPVFAFAKGTRTAHIAAAKPGMKNAARVAICCALGLEAEAEDIGGSLEWKGRDTATGL